MRVVTAAQIAEIDRRASDEFGIPPATLMARAGAAVARVAVRRLTEQSRRRAVVLCGKGNNGGDGLVAARELHRAGVEVGAVLAAAEPEFSGEAARALQEARSAGVPVEAVQDLDPILARADLIVDALFGTGFRGPARGVPAELIERANRSQRPILAVDLPSGVESDTGRITAPCIRAAATVTMGLPKVGLLLYPGAEMAGQVYVADIGYPEHLLETTSPAIFLVTAAMVRSQIPPRPPDAHKGRYGRILIVAGSVGFTGAAVLTTLGALRSGAGLVTVGVPEPAYPIVAGHIVEGMPAPLPASGRTLSAAALDAIADLGARAEVIAAGPGLQPTDGVRAVVRGLLRSARVPLVLDADALNVLAGEAAALREAASPVVITPHPGELARLMGTDAGSIQADRLAAARSAADALRCMVVLKGARTVVAAPDGSAFIVPTGNPGMATGGMGDVLTGAIASLVGQGLAPQAAAYTGAYLHGLAADLIAAERGQAGMLASEVAARLPEAIERVRTGRAADPVTPLAG